ncbi:chemotaxis protein CheW [bacterium]|nr:MAG: chemotaxis protein CheW [bacterium]
MPERVLLFRIGNSYFSLPFSNVEEIVSRERITSREALPEEVNPIDDSFDDWVFAREEWLPIGQLLADMKASSEDQVLMLKREGKTGAYFVDQVLGIETLPRSRPLPEPARRCTDYPLSGLRIWKDRIVLELDLSGLI